VRGQPATVGLHPELPMRDASHTIAEEIHGVVLFVGAVWGVFLLSLAFPAIDRFGVVPRTLIGLVGIPAMPFLHQDLGHILGNTIPLFVLLTLLAGSRARSWEVVADIILVSGALLWVVGRPAVHIGASGLVSGLTSFLILSGLVEKRIIPLLIAVFVGFFYGGSLLLGVIPRFGSQVSWEGHICGAIAGGIIAYLLTAEESGGQDRRRIPSEESLVTG
jgi:membrane associated rhomboid family serine protease